MRRPKPTMPGLWVERASCREVGDMVFFPPDDKPVSRDFYNKAKSICRRCEVQADCLQYGINEAYGVWGGTSPVERQNLRLRLIAEQKVSTPTLRQSWA